ncbi:MAG: hypothetical protein PHH93_08020, partial [Prolixibacteraceae bacterium]|nr:hypothetical protein [Prolixibacteraceae bacterium]
MEHKKLIKILLKDMGELEELISDVKSNGNFEDLEMEFIHTRAKGIMQLLYLLDSNIEKATSGFFNEKDSIALNGYKGEPADMKPDREKLQTETEEVILSEENGFKEPVTEDSEITEKGYIGSEEHREEHVT